MKLFDKVAIIGTGLIGGSMALEIKKKRLAGQIIGVSRHRNTIIWAEKNRIIDKGSQDLAVIKDASLVVLAMPVETIMRFSKKVSKLIRKDCIVTDVGSTKKEIVSKLGNIFANYVGSHPLAGSEKRGIMNVQPCLFEGSLCILTPTKNTSPKALKKMKSLWNQLGARVVFLKPDTHDRILSFASHLPHAVSFSLINSIPDNYLRFAANGLKDTTRIALSDSRLWVDIFLSNRNNMLKSIESFQDNLSRIKSAINKRDERALIRILKKAKAKREALR